MNHEIRRLNRQVPLGTGVYINAPDKRYSKVFTGLTIEKFFASKNCIKVCLQPGGIIVPAQFCQTLNFREEPWLDELDL